MFVIKSIGSRFKTKNMTVTYLFISMHTLAKICTLIDSNMSSVNKLID